MNDFSCLGHLPQGSRLTSLPLFISIVFLRKSFAWIVFLFSDISPADCGWHPKLKMQCFSHCCILLLYNLAVMKKGIFHESYGERIVKWRISRLNFKFSIVSYKYSRPWDHYTFERKSFCNSYISSFLIVYIISFWRFPCI